MKITRKKTFLTPKRTLILSFIVALVLFASLYWWFYIRQAPVSTVVQRPVNSVDYGPATPQEQQDSSTAKQNAVNNSTPATPAPVTSDSLVVTINRAGQAGAGQSVAVRTQINGTTTGTCTMVFSKSGQSTVTKTFSIAMQATTAACNGDIDADQFSTSGDWQLSVTVQTDAIVSKPAAQTVTIQK